MLLNLFDAVVACIYYCRRALIWSMSVPVLYMSKLFETDFTLTISCQFDGSRMMVFVIICSVSIVTNEST